MKIKKYRQIIVFNPEEGKNVSRPIHFVLDDSLQESFNAFNCLLGRRIEDLGHIDVASLVSSRQVLFRRVCLLQLIELIDNCIFNFRVAYLRQSIAFATKVID